VPKTNIQIIDPTKHTGWDELLLTNENTSFFHTSGWAKVLVESYGYKSLYFAQIENGKLKGLLAVMEINSLLTGKRGVSLPFTDHCQVIAKDKDAFEALFEFAVDFGAKRGWKELEIRGGSQYLGSNTPSDTFNTHILDNAPHKDDIISTFRNSTRRNIDKAGKIELKISKSRSFESIKKFYRLNCLTRKDHGLPPQPFFFFNKFFNHIIADHKGLVILAYNHSGTCVAGALFSVFNHQVIFKYGASDKTWYGLRPNNLVMWEAIKFYSQNGYKTFDFGRTDLDHKGLLQFKRGWGTIEDTIHYYNYDLSKNRFVTNYPRIKTSYPIFKKMPIPLLKLIGRILYRHIG
jgi:hypothetical protein